MRAASWGACVSGHSRSVSLSSDAGEHHGLSVACRLPQPDYRNRAASESAANPSGALEDSDG
jgi:hypothetical protein